MDVLSESYQKARKEYECNACLFISEGFGTSKSSLKSFFNYHKFTLTEKKHILNARNKKYKILVGETYLKQTLIDNSSREFYTAKSIPAIHDICCKYNLYEE